MSGQKGKVGVESEKLRLFVSSVQKELEPERLAIASLVTTDPFLSEHVEPVLFNKEPVSGRRASRPYLDCLDTCQVYLLMINRQYGRLHGPLSATHHEYRHAQEKKLPTLIFVKGQHNDVREPKTRDFFKEIKTDGYTYKRFIDRLDLQPEVRAALLRLLKDEYSLVPTATEAKSGKETLEAASPFEAGQTEIPWIGLVQELARDWLVSIGEIAEKRVAKEDIQSALRRRGLLWMERERGEYYALAAGVLFLGKNPAASFPQCKILADAYRGSEPDPNPSDQLTVSHPAPQAVQAVVDFVKKNTRHPPRIVGLKRIVLDEYPEEAVREAIVNAIAHRNYEDRSRAILVEVFFDRIVISSPGPPPKPLTLTKLRRGKYRPCSRNPVLAQCLASLKLMEQRGSGLARMRATMLNHGLDEPEFDIMDGYFQLTLLGPGENLKRLRVPPTKVAELIPPAVEQSLNDRQKQMVALLIRGEELTNRKCQELFKVTAPTVAADFQVLKKVGLARKKGKGRSTCYVLQQRGNH